MIEVAGYPIRSDVVSSFDVAKGGLVPGISDSDSDQLLAELLDFLKSERGFDFTDYKLSTVRRRVDRRMTVLGISSIRSYCDFLKSEPAEFPLLLDLLLINVTDFFRDHGAWEALSQVVSDQVKDAVRAERQFRVWCPGCATGEEAYTVAIVLCELMGEDSFRSFVRIFATDIDENALVQARSGNYTARQMEALRPRLREKYFTAHGGSYVFRSDLRPSLIFGRHDVISDPPITRLDLLSFRNTLIYFNSDLQRRILERFRTAIAPGGVLFVGRAESLVLQQDYFRAVDAHNRIFEPVQQQKGVERISQTSSFPVLDGAGPIGMTAIGAAQAGPYAQFIFDLDRKLIGANSSARAQFSITERDLGQSVDDLLSSRLSFSLTPAIESVHATLSSQTYCGLERNLAGDHMQYLDVVVSPLVDDVGGPIGTSVVAIDRSELVLLRMERDLALENTQAVSEELKSSIQDLQSTNEELETSNEELQSMIEELQTANEELNVALVQVDSPDESGSTPWAESGHEILRFLESTSGGVLLIVDGVVRYANASADGLFASIGRGLVGISWDALAPLMVSETGTDISAASGGGDGHSISVAITTPGDLVIRCRLQTIATVGDPVGRIVLLLPGGDES